MDLSHNARRGLAWAGALVAVAVLGLLVTRVDAGSGHARAHVVSAGGAAELTKSVSGDAVLRTGAMRPGQRVSGTVTVENGGDATGAFQLAQSDVLDTPGSDGGRLSTMVRLTVEDRTTGRRIYRGRLGAMAAYPLGYLRAGEDRTYGFSLEFPAGVPRNTYAGSQAAATFDWTARTGEPPPARDTAPPTVLARAERLDGRTLRVGLTCSERCEVVGLSPGAFTSPRGSLHPGRPELRSVSLSRAEAAALYGLLRKRGQATLTLRVTVADGAGNRRTVTAALRLRYA
jgi:hypothetical protein